jgi:hypothetical protein
LLDFIVGVVLFNIPQDRIYALSQTSAGKGRSALADS